MDELIIDDKKYISSKHAAKITGYAKDYVGQLCREGRVEARLVGRSWYVLEDSVREHRYGKENEVSVAESTAINAPEEPIHTNAYSNVTYTKEETPFLPELQEKKEEAYVSEAIESSTQRDRGVTDMQSVWKEWFSTRPLNASDEPEITAEDTQEIYKDSPTLSEALHDEILMEESVPIHRTYTEGSSEDAYTEENAGNSFEEEEGNVPAVSRRHRSSLTVGINTAVVRAGLIAVIIIVTGFTVIGTGFGDSFLGSGSTGKNPLFGAVIGASYVDNSK